DDRVEVPAVGLEVDARPVGRPVVLRGQEVRQRLQPPVEVRLVVTLRRARDRVAELLAGVVLDRQHAVDVPVQAQRADHVVGRSDQVVPAQRPEALVLLACHQGRLVQVSEPRAVELADDLGAAGLFLVRVDLVAAGQPKDAERRLLLAYPQAITDDPTEEAMERVVARHVSDVFPLHRSLPPRAGSQSGGIPRRAVPSPWARYPRHVMFTAPLPDTETPGSLLIRGRSRRWRVAGRDGALPRDRHPCARLTCWTSSGHLSRVLATRTGTNRT